MTRRIYIAAAALGAALPLAAALVPPAPRLLWNVSASAPIGLYALYPAATPSMGSLVAAAPPAPLAAWLAERRYLARHVPLLKHVAAIAGQQVCRMGHVLSIDGRPVAKALAHDRQGRPLPVWQGCRTLKPGEMLLLNASVADSMDSRYFGPLPTSALLGRARPLLTRDAPGAPLVWRGPRP